MIQSGAPSATCPCVFLSRGRRLLPLVPPRMYQSGASAAACPQMIQSRGRRLLLLVPPRMLQSGAPLLFAPLFAVVGLWLLILVSAPSYSCSAPDDPVRGVSRHLFLDDPVRGAAAPAACSAPDDPVWGVWSPARPRPGHGISASPRAPPLCCFTASPRLRLRGRSSASPRPRRLRFSSALSTCVFLLGLVLFFVSLHLLGPGLFSASLPLLGLVLLAASLHNRGLLHWTASQLHHGPVHMTAALYLLGLVLICVSLPPWPCPLWCILSCLLRCDSPVLATCLLASGRHFPLDAPVRGVGAPPVCSAPDDPVRGARPPLVPGRSSPGAAAPFAWCAPEAPVWGVRSPGRSLASSPLRCFSSASPSSPPLCFYSGSWCPRAAGVRLGGRPTPAGVWLGTVSRAVVVCVWCALSEFAAPLSRCCLAPGIVLCLSPAACLSGVPRGPALVKRHHIGDMSGKQSRTKSPDQFKKEVQNFHNVCHNVCAAPGPNVAPQNTYNLDEVSNTASSFVQRNTCSLNDKRTANEVLKSPFTKQDFMWSKTDWLTIKFQ